MTKKEIELLAQNLQSTVIAEYIPSERKAKNYQSEQDLEDEFIEQLKLQDYEHLHITDNDKLVKNLRENLEKLNDYVFTDNEWRHFFETEIANKNQNIEDKTITIQEDYIKILNRDNQEFKNIYLLDKKNIHKNNLQVINQYATEGWERSNRYDVTVLVNGLPLVHIELKRRWIALQEAFNQINRYQRESFWADSGLFEYIQLFVISNGTYTKYYSNTTRYSHITEQDNRTSNKWKKSSKSFEFTSWWADCKNKSITDLIDFAKTFFAKHTLLNIITKYCVFTAERQLLAMRPYQIVATEKIINKITTSAKDKKYGTVDAGGYIWHTTGSWKTLTSFKTAQIASKLPYIKKVLFVVDRKDLDTQTMIEYNRFEKGAADSNTSTAALIKQLENTESKIIITTIQKLYNFISTREKHSIFDWEIVIIFDECHRSQFGNMHKKITKAFKKYYIFGFTGTPIFAINSSSWSHPDLKTTQQIFWEKLHTYTIVDAIADKNVLPFKIDYISTIKKAENIEDKSISDIDRQNVLSEPKRITNIVKYIREHFDQKTKRNSVYTLKQKRLAGFNSMFAVSSIKMAKLYYTEFQKQLEWLPSDKQLKVATIFSYTTNEEEPDWTIDENPENTDGLDKTSRDFLESAIEDYNKLFWTSFDTSADKFQNYYKDVSERTQSREVDILIVVNMFLTGFDAPTLNTLWVDKFLKSHWLIQAFSRTNRILNSIKTFGNIVCFRNLEKATSEAVSLFGDKNASGIVLLKTFDEYYDGYIDWEKKVRWYKTLIEELNTEFPISEVIISETAKKDFIKLYGRILKLHNILTTFDEFKWNEILSHRDIQDYHALYLDLYREFRVLKEDEKENINDDLIFEMELIKQIEVNIDYIIELIKEYHLDNMKDKEILNDINKSINSSEKLRNKKDLIKQFIKNLDASSSIDKDWIEYVKRKKAEELSEIIDDEKLDKDKTCIFIEDAFRNGYIQKIWTWITEIIPPSISRFSPDQARTKKKEIVIDKLSQFFDRFFDISCKESV